jgi:hypothetical protein
MAASRPSLVSRFAASGRCAAVNCQLSVVNRDSRASGYDARESGLTPRQRWTARSG